MRPIEALVVPVVWAMLGGAGCGDSSLGRHTAPNDADSPAAGRRGQSHESAAGAPVGDEPSDAGADSAMNAGGDAGAAPEAAGGTGTSVGTQLAVAVSSDTPTFVNLEAARPVALDETEAATSKQWDLSFRGWDIFTNGGASGSGEGAAFGPLPFTYFTAASDPTEVPFSIEDKPAGAFRDWYLYDGQWHSLYSRYHVYGVRSGSRLFKLQVLGYYGDVRGAPISALYRLRYAEVTPTGAGAIEQIVDLDGTAGGLGGDEDSASGCLSLATGEVRALTPDEASSSRDWDLSFRRDSISINGGLGGPGDVTAVDLDASASETLDAVKAFTPENRAARFADVDYRALTAPGLKYRGDRIVSAFSDAWVELSAEPPTLPRDNTWLVVGANGKSRFLLALERVERATPAAAGRVVMRVVKVR